MKPKASQQKRFLKLISLPIRALSKARDFYVKSMTQYADRMNSCNLMAIPITSGLPRSFSVRPYNGDEDFQELVRASSTRSFRDRVDLDLQQTKVKPVGPPRSSSVAMGRIDEDRPCCYVGEDDRNLVSAKNEIKYLAF